ncbi:hypothetical protein CH375_02970 [Leptospira ellisii]|uniref:Uncharacterized protein n=1 Tax=Leptospira ellisii TaxID=2023197 RepID=A0A2N0B816_9LEPT|nr:hypothetical protein CH379_11990 [Leptospira ellisii]PKA05819.1 hypothetical protein CH375_02970 [Leptospira ellisii]
MVTPKLQRNVSSGRYFPFESCPSAFTNLCSNSDFHTPPDFHSLKFVVHSSFLCLATGRSFSGDSY